jgi:hypothetical protein
LLVFVIVAYLLLLHLANAAIAVVIAVVAKEGVVFLVSTAFFLKLGTAKEQVSRAHGVAIVQATSKATGALFPIPVSAVQPWRNQLSSDR